MKGWLEGQEHQTLVTCEELKEIRRLAQTQQPERKENRGYIGRGTT